MLGPSAPVDPASLAPGEKPPFDTAGVADPCLLPRVTVDGTLHVRVLYTGYDATATGTIGFAARYGDHGPLVKQPNPVYSVNTSAAAPTLLAWGDDRYAMLYVEQSYALDSTTVYPAVAAAFAPPTFTLPQPTSYATGP